MYVMSENVVWERRRTWDMYANRPCSYSCGMWHVADQKTRLSKNVREMRSPHWQHLLHWLSASHWTRPFQFYSQKTHLHVNLQHKQYCCQPEKRVSPHPLQSPSLELVFQAPKNHGSDFRWLSCIWLSLYPKCRQNSAVRSRGDNIHVCDILMLWLNVQGKQNIKKVAHWWGRF